MPLGSHELIKEETMNTSRLVGGIICVAIAALLTVLNLRLPPEDLMFMIGSVNMPWVPPIVLAIVGVVLLSTARQAQEETEEQPPAMVVDPAKAALNKRLENTAWGCFLILLGGFLFVPDQIVRGGWWSIGVGLIMLGLNLARYLNGLRMSGFTTFLGILSVAGGVLDLAGMEGVNGAVLFIVLGGYLVLKSWFDERALFGKAEQA
jgi:hypothetical protein